MLASNGWQRATKEIASGDHAEHIHANCQCEFAIRFTSELDVAGYEPDKLREEYDAAEGDSSKEKINSLRRKNYAEKTIGAVSRARNPNGKAAEEHAIRYYEEIRKRASDVNKIAAATGYEKEEIQAVKNYIFMDKHDLRGEEKELFDPDYMMAESWRRLQEGKAEPHDLTLIKHELLEKSLVEKGYTQKEAHKIASKMYNYGKEAEEYYDRIKKYKKE